MFKINKNGMGMVEVMVAAAMAAMVSLGVATMMQNSMKESRRVQMLDTLKNKKILFENMLRDPDIWSATLNGNASAGTAPFNTLASGTTATAEIAYTSPAEFKLYNSDGSLAHDLLGQSDMTGNGFSERGTACSTFNGNTNAGNDNCPISYRLLVAADCLTGASCTNPSLKLVARLVYNPASTGTLAAFTSFLNPVSGFSIADTVVDGKYDAVVKRTSTAVNRSFRLVSGFTPTTGGCATGLTDGGAGRCHDTTATVHERTTQLASADGHWDDTGAVGGSYDTYNLVSPQAGTTGYFRFNEQGYYSCAISVPAFATGSFTAYLTKMPNTDVAQSTITAPQYAQAVANIDAKFNVTSTSDDYAIREQCEVSGTAGTNYEFCTLGIPTTVYGGFFSVVTVNCSKIDKSF